MKRGGTSSSPYQQDSPEDEEATENDPVREPRHLWKLGVAGREACCSNSRVRLLTAHSLPAIDRASYIGIGTSDEAR